MNYFETPFSGKSLKEQITNPNILVGRHSYYSGYYHGHSFEHCVRYLAPNRNDVDKLIIGHFCSIGTGAVFMIVMETLLVWAYKIMALYVYYVK